MAADPVVHPLIVGVMFAVNAVESSKVTTVPAEDEGHINAGVELKATVWRLAALPVPVRIEIGAAAVVSPLPFIVCWQI